MNFIYSKDFRLRIKDKELNTLTEGDTDLLDQSEGVAIEKVKDYLRNKFDLTTLFILNGNRD